MTTRQAESLALRQHALLARSAVLRANMGMQLQVLEKPLAVADEVRAGWRWLLGHPEWPLGAAAVVVVMRPLRVARLSLRLWSAWRLARSIQRRLHNML
jgi:hypothetical protein